MSERMQILVIGATSQIGHFLLPRLAAAGEEVLALSRRPRDGHPDWIVGQLPGGMPPLPPLKAVVCLGPLNGLSPWLAQTRLSGTPHIVATSSMSAETKRDSSNPAERELSRILRDAETELSTTCAVTGVPIALDELTYWNVDRQEAYALCSVACDLRIHEVVDVPNWVVGMFLPESILAGRS